MTHRAHFCEMEFKSVLKWEQFHGTVEVVRKPATKGEAGDFPRPLQMPL
jgi:hypothetical protein